MAWPLHLLRFAFLWTRKIILRQNDNVMNYAAKTEIFRKIKPLFTNLSIADGRRAKMPKHLKMTKVICGRNNQGIWFYIFEPYL